MPWRQLNEGSGGMGSPIVDRAETCRGRFRCAAKEWTMNRSAGCGLADGACRWRWHCAGIRRWRMTSRRSRRSAKDYEKVVIERSTASPSTTLWVRKKDGQMLAELPRGLAERQKHFFAMTVASAARRSRACRARTSTPTGSGTTSGSPSSSPTCCRSAPAGMPSPRLRSTRSGLTVSSSTFPSSAMGPGGQPVIDMDALILGNGRHVLWRQRRRA